jgi:hypothetical protein
MSDMATVLIAFWPQMMFEHNSEKYSEKQQRKKSNLR